jgi:hypothetical protein
MNTTLEYSTRVVQEGDRRCKKSTLNDLAYLTPLRIPLMNPVHGYTLHSVQLLLSATQMGLAEMPRERGGRFHSSLLSSVAVTCLVRRAVRRCRQCGPSFHTPPGCPVDRSHLEYSNQVQSPFFFYR